MTSPLISILIPTLGRATRLPAVAENCHAATESTHEIIFIAEPEDIATQETVRSLGDVLNINSHRKCYSGALNSAFPQSKGSYIFTGSDDLNFHAGWDKKVLRVMKPPTMVGGTNDLSGTAQVNAGVMATHMLLSRKYIEEVGCVIGEPPGTVSFEQYGHHFGEAEMVSTAIMRGVFTPSLDSIVEHRHWSRTGQRDSTTELNEAREGGDHELCVTRTRTLVVSDPSVLDSEAAWIAYATGRLKERGVL